ncbi:hypothetical protein E6R41_26135 [Citrobacter freundii]|nr:hypothetical protein E6R41_26135 [Citrobacter freundii]TYR84129.1 hypothetical protein FYK57_28275 [Citrobacter freundii]
MKKLRFITAKDKRQLDEHIQNNRYLNAEDNIRQAKLMGYTTSRSAMYRYMTELRVKNNDQY